MAQFGFKEVQTYIQSGNLILSKDESFDAKWIESLIEESFNAKCKAFCFELDDFIEIINACPFSPDDLSKLYFTFLESNSKESLERID